jgi:hypothetical protein
VALQQAPENSRPILGVEGNGSGASLPRRPRHFESGATAQAIPDGMPEHAQAPKDEHPAEVA